MLNWQGTEAIDHSGFRRTKIAIAPGRDRFSEAMNTKGPTTLRE